MSSPTPEEPVTSAPLLQLALDHISRDGAYELLDQIEEEIDIVEVGTPLMMRYGTSIVSDLRARYPRMELLCDAKIMDAADLEARLCFDAGSDYVTFLALTDDSTVAACVEVAREYGRRVMADMICVPDLAVRAAALQSLGVDIIAVHTGVDQQAQGRTPLDDLAVLRRSAGGTPLAVAGGITVANVTDYVQLDPAIVIVGGGITASADPAIAARALRSRIHGEQPDGPAHDGDRTSRSSSVGHE
jgi:3-hexulose-6-phosphate synthase